MNKPIFVVAVSLLLPGLLFSEQRTGEQVYKASCATCHSIGVANAPKFNDTTAWKSKNKTIEQFVESSKKGINAMPPMGTCTNCTDEELKASIEYMIGEEK